MRQPGPITITAFKWVPPFAQGQVRDLRLRWMLREAGWHYTVDLITGETLQTAEYRAQHPFGQVPVLREAGRPTLFETGGIVLDIAARSGKLLPADEGDRALARCWTYAALNSVEPFLTEVALADFFIEDKAAAKAYRPFAVKMATERLEKLAAALGEREWLVANTFTIADLMMACVVKVANHAELLPAHPNLVAWRDRCFERPAHIDAAREQSAEYAAHGPADMGFNPADFETA